MNLRIPNCFGTYCLMNDGTIELSWFCRDRSGWARMLSLVKSIPRRVFDSETKKWYIPATWENFESLQQSGWRESKKSAVKQEPDKPFGGMPIPAKYKEAATAPEEVPESDPVELQRQSIDSCQLDSSRFLVSGLRPYQVDFIKFASLRNGRVALGDGMGCIDGDAVVGVNRHGKSWKVPLSRLHAMFHGDRGRYTREERPWFVRCLRGDGGFGLGQVVDVVDSGTRDCVRVTFADGSSLVCTPDHEVMTDGGYVRADALEGRMAMMNGTDACPKCGGREDLITYRYSKFRGYCRRCMYGERVGNRWKDREIHEVVHADGYVYLYGYPLRNYDGCRRTDGIPKHRYVMEQMLGRKLLPGEVVHHVNGDPRDNRPENLVLCEDQAAHNAQHRDELRLHFKHVNPHYVGCVSVTPVGPRHVYDVKVLNHGNFIADGAVVHNCGKTLEALAWVAYNQSFPALIVVNAPTKLQWKKEYRRWISDAPGCLPVQILSGTKPRKLGKTSSCIINWDILTHWQDELAAAGFECLIGDEAQAIGNPESKRALAFRHLAAVIPECIVMSGTPARSRPAQFWTMVSCVEPKMFPTYKGYLWRYTKPRATQWGITFDGARNVKELHGKLVSVMLRRTKEEVMSYLPPKTIDVVPLEADSSEMEEYTSEESQVSELNGMEARERLANLTRTAYAVKEKSLLNWVRQFLESGEKLLLFAWHRDVVDRLFEELSDFGPAKIYGGVSLQEREAEKERFIGDESCRVMVCNIQSGGTGIDGFQQVCCNVAFAEFASTSTDMEQAEDRLHRGGQDRPVTVYYLVAPGTIDEDMAEALDEKKKVLASVLDGKEVKDIDLIGTIAARRGIKI